MSRRKKDNEYELISKIINIYLEGSIRESQLYLKLLDNQVKSYQEKLQLLEMDKPFFFQKKKLGIYNQSIKDCERKIKDIYLKIGEEIEEIQKTQQIINL